jgi:hypothetical protein
VGNEDKMITIFVPLKDGEAIMPEVMNGILSQSLGCCIVPITSKGEEKYRETNRNDNILRALALNKTDKFILMDSDVAIGNPLMIEEMLNDKANMDKEIISVTTKKENITKCSHIPHSLILIKGSMLTKFTDYLEKLKIDPAIDDDKHCSLCFFFRDKGDNTIFLQNDKNHEIKRLDLTKEA